MNIIIDDLNKIVIDIEGKIVMIPNKNETEWVLTTGIWNDNNYWNDEATWNDGEE